MTRSLALEVGTELAETAMLISPSHSTTNSSSSSGNGNGNGGGRHDTLRLSDIENAHLCPSGRIKMEELFRQWLNVDGTKEMIYSLVEDVRHGKDIQIEALTHALSGNPAMYSSVDLNSPSRSPKRPPNHQNFGQMHRKKQHVVSLFDEEDLHQQQQQQQQDTTMQDVDGDHSMENNSHPVKSSTPISTPTTSSTNQHEQLRHQIPRFYTPGEGRRGRIRLLSSDSLARRTNDIEGRFTDFPEGMKVEDFVAITKDLCGFPSFFNAPFFRRILSSSSSSSSSQPSSPMKDNEASQRITKQMFETYWLKEMAPYDTVERFFRLVKQPAHDYIERDDFAPYLHELLKYHPGLEFLGGTPEFQEKYALTVVVRIFYSVDRDSSGRITLRKLRRSNLIEAFNTVDEEEDINKVNSYFSYEHFYVLYCKFWELDTDHDFILSQDDLVRYGGHSLTRIIIDRVFEHGRRPFARVQNLTWEEKKKMSYEDFIYFMLSEEDKSNPVSLRYWYELIDTNEDGIIRADEMRIFYRHQIHRMECLGHEVVPFEDILCQMADLLHPKIDGEFHFEDFIREDKIRVSGVFFNVLFNLSKFIEFEQRDPFLLRQQLAEPELTDWDRYARAEYARLAMEEEGREDDNAMDIDTMDGWYVSEDQEEDIEIMGNKNSTVGRTAEAPF